MKRVLIGLASCLLVSIGTLLGPLNKGFAGPIIVGNGSGLSEFNVLYWQRQLSYYLAQCQAQTTCYSKLATRDWASVEDVVNWMVRAPILFENEATMGKAEVIVEPNLGVVRLNKSALWVKSASGDPEGMNLEAVSDFMWIGLERFFLLGTPGFSDFRDEFKKVIQARAGEYSITLADGRRLATATSENGVAGFAILDTDEKAEALLFPDLNDFSECQATDGTLKKAISLRLQNLDFAFFVGRLGSEPDSSDASNVDLIFNGRVVYDCEHAGTKWSEKANARLTVRLSQMKTAYDFVPSATRVRFDSIERL